MPTDVSFLASFANQPLTLLILVVGGVIALYIIKIGPALHTYNNGYDKLRSELGALGNSIKTIEADSATRTQATANSIEAINAVLLSINQDNKQQGAEILKLQFINSGLPLEFRLDAYDTYRSAGYNGWGSLYYDRVLKPLAEADLDRKEAQAAGKGG
jgi:hypothetical protein